MGRFPIHILRKKMSLFPQKIARVREKTQEGGKDLFGKDKFPTLLGRFQLDFERRADSRQNLFFRRGPHDCRTITGGVQERKGGTSSTSGPPPVSRKNAATKKDIRGKRENVHRVSLRENRPPRRKRDPRGGKKTDADKKRGKGPPAGKPGDREVMEHHSKRKERRDLDVAKKGTPPEKG